MAKTGRLGQTAWFWPGMAKTGHLDQDRPSWSDALVLTWYGQDALVLLETGKLDPESLALSQYEWLQFEEESATLMRCCRILRMSVPTLRCIDWGLLADAGEAVRARAILGEDTPWTRLFDLAELPTYRLITVEFLSTFRYRAHQPAGEEGVMRAWWAQISDVSFTGHRFDDQRSSDPLYPPLHRDDHFRPCNLARPFALYYASFYHRQERGTLWGGAFVTHIARTRGMVDMLDDLPAIKPCKLDRWTVISMKLAADIPGLGLRFIGQDGRPFQAAQVIVLPEQQQQQDGGPMPKPEPIREEPVQSPPHEEEPPQHPPHVYRAVRLTEPLEALLHHIVARCEETAQRMAHVERRLDHYEDLVQWTVASEHARRDGTQLPPFPEPRVYADDGPDAGPSGS
ncbi:hypothetical protein E3N88_01130 [Mikania micrantha]|uniref:Uncharacterized protein n=1 Tax=Mikania micrantha TaxID=192012 RepID=A0A5N6Q050_9ASTR|nr:hypothetical protein E3N88_01130 [Mikania micrantha]